MVEHRIPCSYCENKSRLNCVLCNGSGHHSVDFPEYLEFWASAYRDAQTIGSESHCLVRMLEVVRKVKYEAEEELRQIEKGLADIMYGRREAT